MAETAAMFDLSGAAELPMADADPALSSEHLPLPAARSVPWRGRKRVAEARGKFVAIRCTDAEYETFMAAAGRAGLSVGAYFRTLALGVHQPRAARRPTIERVELARVLGELGRLGSAVNELGRRANPVDCEPGENPLRAIADDVQAMRGELMKALGRGD